MHIKQGLAFIQSVSKPKKQKYIADYQFIDVVAALFIYFFRLHKKNTASTENNC